MKSQISELDLLMKETEVSDIFRFFFIYFRGEVCIFFLYSSRCSFIHS